MSHFLEARYTARRSSTIFSASDSILLLSCA
nr:MAG TPA: hypothetical protein [Caudoviricetes sp.]